MIRWWRRLIFFCTDDQTEIKTRLFRVILLLSEIACVVATIVNAFVVRAGFRVVSCTIAGGILLALSFWFTVRLKDCRNLFAIMIFLTNSVLLPFAFVYSGGIRGGVPIWMAFGLALVFTFLEGWRFIIVIITSACSMVTAYAFCLFNPEYIVRFGTRGQEIVSSCMGIILIGFVTGLIFFFQRHLYEKQKELSDKQQETIQRISDSRNMFFTNMSHEIRTPINTIIGLNEMTLREDISDEVAENAINIQNASKILLALINDILDLSKIESGRMEIVPVQYETSAMFSDLVNIIWIRAHEKRLEFHIDIAEDIPSVLYGDEVRIKQILVNLLSNAVKYTQKGSVSLTVRGERLDTKHVRIRFEVRDTGIGIRRENMEDLFSSFRRVDEVKNRKVEGTGLGLSIAKQLVDMMNGTITVDSIYTKGSVFTVTLDQQIMSDRPVGTIRYSMKHSGKERPKYNRRFEAPEARVLIVDDNEMNLMVAKKLLRGTKVQVETALSGKECLKKTLTDFYHVILMDHVMPEMDGEETLNTLRKRREGYCQDSPVIALTANVMSNAEEWYREKGFDGYIAKPVNGFVLEAVLQKFLPPELIEYSSAEDDGTGDSPSAMIVHGKKRLPIRITTDCVCDLPADLLEKYGIKIMYYYITTETGRFRDGEELFPMNLLEYMGRGNRVVSEHPPVDEYEEFFADNLLEAEQVIHISMSAQTSGGYEAAANAAKGFGNVHVLDSCHLSSGLGLLVLRAAQMAQAGASVQEIEQKIVQLRDKVSTSFVVASPDNLYLGGRVSWSAWRLCHLLQLHPMFMLSRGRLRLACVFAGRMGTMINRTYIRSQLRSRRKIDDEILFVTYAGCTVAQLEEIRKEIEKRMKFKAIRFQPASATVASNCGIGAFGLLYMRK